jgi:hypothetical protein
LQSLCQFANFLPLLERQVLESASEILKRSSCSEAVLGGVERDDESPARW